MGKFSPYQAAQAALVFQERLLNMKWGDAKKLQEFIDDAKAKKHPLRKIIGEMFAEDLFGGEKIEVVIEVDAKSNFVATVDFADTEMSEAFRERFGHSRGTALGKVRVRARAMQKHVSVLDLWEFTGQDTVPLSILPALIEKASEGKKYYCFATDPQGVSFLIRYERHWITALSLRLGMCIGGEPDDGEIFIRPFDRRLRTGRKNQRPLPSR